MLFFLSGAIREKNSSERRAVQLHTAETRGKRAHGFLPLATRRRVGRSCARWCHRHCATQENRAKAELLTQNVSAFSLPCLSRLGLVRARSSFFLLFSLSLYLSPLHFSSMLSLSLLSCSRSCLVALLPAEGAHLARRSKGKLHARGRAVGHCPGKSRARGRAQRRADCKAECHGRKVANRRIRKMKEDEKKKKRGREK